MCDDATRADHLADLRISVQWVEIARSTRVAHQLQVCYWCLDQMRNFITNLDIFIIEFLCSLRGHVGNSLLFDLFADDNHRACVQYGLIVLISVTSLHRDNVHRRTIYYLAIL